MKYFGLTIWNLKHYVYKRRILQPIQESYIRNIEELSEMSVSDLRLGMTLDETQKILGEDYQDGGYYDEEINQFILTRTYEDGIQLFLIR